jgi:hypothetical protein
MKVIWPDLTIVYYANENLPKVIDELAPNQTNVSENFLQRMISWVKNFVYRILRAVGLIAVVSGTATTVRVS